MTDFSLKANALRKMVLQSKLGDGYEYDLGNGKTLYIPFNAVEYVSFGKPWWKLRAAEVMDNLINLKLWDEKGGRSN
jgi:hypothetical protein